MTILLGAIAFFMFRFNPFSSIGGQGVFAAVGFSIAVGIVSGVGLIRPALIAKKNGPQTASILHSPAGVSLKISTLPSQGSEAVFKHRANPVVGTMTVSNMPNAMVANLKCSLCGLAALPIANFCYSCGSPVNRTKLTSSINQTNSVQKGELSSNGSLSEVSVLLQRYSKHFGRLLSEISSSGYFIVIGAGILALVVLRISG
jgi:hypothetical protein